MVHGKTTFISNIYQKKYNIKTQNGKKNKKVERKTKQVEQTGIWKRKQNGNLEKKIGKEIKTHKLERKLK